MVWQIVSAVASAVSCLGVLVALLALVHQRRAAQEQPEQNLAFAGAQAAMAWRQQLLDLHDRGMTVEQIRSVFALESGSEGYERENGDLVEILRHVPRRTAPAPGRRGPLGWFARR